MLKLANFLSYIKMCPKNQPSSLLLCFVDDDGWDNVDTKNVEKKWQELEWTIVWEIEVWKEREVDKETMNGLLCGSRK